MLNTLYLEGQSWSSYGSLIYHYLCNQCLSPLTLWVRTLIRRDVIDATLWDIVCQWLTAGQWFSPDTLVSSTNKTDHYDITEVLLKVALNTITLLQEGHKCRIFYCLYNFFYVILFEITETFESKQVWNIPWRVTASVV